MNDFSDFLSIEKFRKMFYVVSPNETLYATTADVPRMLDEVS